jgi:phospholipid N-methyltransferase
MLDMASLQEARCVVELGAGTGVYTGEILTRMPADGSLFAFEVDPELAASVSRTITDPRLNVLNESAEDVRDHLPEGRADLIVSGLPYTSLPAPVRRRILDESRRALEPDGTMLVLQYSPFVQTELRRRFNSVRRRISPVNVPPACLFACTGPRSETAPA